MAARIKFMFVCPFCKDPFLRYVPPSRRSSTIFCSKKCKDMQQKITGTGANNPNYRHGKQSGPQFCSCGREKDYRAEKCTHCVRGLLGDNETMSSRPIYARPRLNLDMENVKGVVAASSSLLEASRILGVSRGIITRWVAEHGADVSHFRAGRGRPYKMEDVLIKSPSLVRKSSVKAVVLREGLLAYTCSSCGLSGTWNGSKLTLELDHINGDRSDNRLENLRFLCPNCHSQTPTHRGRSGKSIRKSYYLENRVIEDFVVFIRNNPSATAGVLMDTNPRLMNAINYRFHGFAALFEKLTEEGKL